MATIKKATVSEITNGLRWTFASGRAINVDFDSLIDVWNKAAAHGIKQKLSDTYAGFKTTHEVEAAFETALDALLLGNWNAGRSSSGGIWVEALAKAAGVEIAVAIEKWIEIGEEGQKGLKKDAAIKLAKAQIEMERAAEKAKGSKFDLDAID